MTGLDRPWGFQEDEAPRFQDNRHMKFVSPTGRLFPPPPRKYYLYSFLLEAEPTRAIVWPEGLCQWKIPMSLSGIEPANFRLITSVSDSIYDPVKRVVNRDRLCYKINQHTRHHINTLLQYSLVFIFESLCRTVVIGRLSMSAAMCNDACHLPRNMHIIKTNKII